MLTRRMVFLGAIALGTRRAEAADERFARLEAQFGGRLGVAVRDTGSGKTFSWRGGMRFAMCSTFKLLLAAAVLQRVASGKERLNRKVSYTAADVVVWSPLTEKHAGDAMTVSELIDAILIVSDNTAANLLLNAIGGPQAWTDFARSLGDRISRLDRIEPALNSAVPGDDRDTTTPEAMLADLQEVLIGDALNKADRDYLMFAMGRSATGIHRLRAGLPQNWGIADKTGTGDNGSCNDIAIIFPPGRKPILACAYYTGSTRPPADREAVLAEVGRVIAAM